MSISTIADGNWLTASIWSGGVVPVPTDDVIIQHEVTVTSDIAVASILIDNGSFIVKPSLTASISITCPKIEMTGMIIDRRRILMEGAKLIGVHPCISCIHSESENFWATNTLWFDSAIPTGNITRYAPSTGDQVIYSMDDTTPLNRSATLEDQEAKGNYDNGTITICGKVPNLSISIKWPRAEALPYREILRRMIESPYQVLAVTPTTVIKGYIEQIQYSNPTNSYYNATISIVNGVHK